MGTVYFLSCVQADCGGGIYSYDVLQNGTLKAKKYLPCDKPMYAVKSENRLHILLRSPFENSRNSGYFTVSEDFSERTEIMDTKGECACHLCVSDNDCYITNYLSGNIVKNNSFAVTHTGKGINPERQEMPHTHCAAFSTDKKIVFNTDLGTDTVFAYDRDLKEISRIKLDDGYGVRHLAVSKNGHTLYAVSELIPSVCRLSFKDNRFEVTDTLMLPCENSDSTGAAVRLSDSEKYLYVSVRSENAIFTTDTENKNLRIIQKYSCGGKGPRDFDVYGGKLLFCCNEDSDNISVFSLSNGIIKEQTDNIKMQCPLCVVK